MNVLLVTPPFTQLNSPYPATAFLKRFLVEKKINTRQIDLGIDLFLMIFSKSGLTHISEIISEKKHPVKSQSRYFLSQIDRYLETIDNVVKFLQIKDSSLAYQICKPDYLPKGSRFSQFSELDWMFGNLGLIDKACFLSTLYLEDLLDIIRAEITPKFGFSRYAEKLALSATDFSDINKSLEEDETFIDLLMKKQILDQVEEFKPNLVGFTVPFPGCLYAALKCGRSIKKKHPNIQIAIGGGYPSTELRDLAEPRVFNYCDYIVLDQGESAILNIVNFLKGELYKDLITNTYYLDSQKIIFKPSQQHQISIDDSGYPDYSDLDFSKYLSIIEIPNPMHRLWNDGKWNKLAAAKGCYWQKCSFCDTSLDYIKNYEPASARILVDRMIEINVQTGSTGFHFVDEAAPPAVLKNLAIELLRQKKNFQWWGNIRFERNFSLDVCRLLSKSGCIAVSGGLETVTDRLLALINKGITLSQAIETLAAFKESGIMVHAYLMYGFPTQTAQETIDSLEIVRQLFENQLLHSCYWHRFSLTAHSPIAANPGKFKIKILGPPKGKFAWNDLIHEDLEGCEHDAFASGLEKAVYNFMMDIGIEYEIQDWFDFQVPKPTIAPDFVSFLTEHSTNTASKNLQNRKLIWLGNQVELFEKRKKKSKAKYFLNHWKDTDYYNIEVDALQADWILDLILKAKNKTPSFSECADDFKERFGGSLEDFMDSPLWSVLRNWGLVMV